jgi:hypothetical protein
MGCAAVRVTSTQRTATEQFLVNLASTKAIEQLSASGFRDREVYIDSRYLTAATQPSDDHSYLLGELRSRLLASGVRLVEQRHEAQIILEIRSQAVGTDRYETLVGLPAIGVTEVGDSTTLATPELAFYKHTTQKGYTSVAFVAYWSDSGELIAASGPCIGSTRREDVWFFGFGPRTVGDIPTAGP